MDESKVQDVSWILNQLKDAKGSQEKLVHAANLLAELGVIAPTPHAKEQWRIQ